MWWVKAPHAAPECGIFAYCLSAERARRAALPRAVMAAPLYRNTVGPRVMPVRGIAWNLVTRRAHGAGSGYSAGRPCPAEEHLYAEHAPPSDSHSQKGIGVLSRGITWTAVCLLSSGTALPSSTSGS